MSAFLEQYEPLDVIGNGSFGIIRKVRRKSDGLIFARKELNFERMSERDRKQIVAEVNILKDLHHEHIVRYHDRHVDRDAGILYIIMEYCGGGDLSTVIKQAAKHNRPISEDLIWNYFMQILLALHHCHHPNGHGRSGSGSGSALTEGEGGGSSRRPQILHRDLKPDNVFLDENNNVKLGDFGLSKALNQASFANTYVGTPYYMSPELMQEKAYDSKSDIWSLGCLIYELCALKPPFHEAKTHNELSILIRNGRIPPLPRGYSQALFGVIKAMLNLNPAMRPSAAQLLQHERLELVFKVAETEKMLSTVKAHKNAMVAREREVLAREQIIAEKEQHLQHLFSQKDSEIAHLQRVVSQLQAQIHTIQSEPRITQHDLEVATKHAVARREQELRILVQKREEEVAAAMAKREEEIMEAVRRREAEVCEAWAKREAEVRQEVEVSIKAVEERIQWISEKEAELIEEEERLEALREELEVREKRVEELANKKGRTKSPLEEIRNTMEPTPQRRNYDPPPSTIKRNRVDSTPRATTKQMFPAALETPITRPSYTDYLPSAMKGVVLTSTGETLATPSPNELATLFNASPKVGLNFGKIFDFGEGDDDVTSPTNTTTRLSLGGAGSGLNGVGASGVNGGVQFPNGAGSESDEDDAPPSPTTRKERELRERAESRSSLGGGEDATVTIAMNLGSATNGASVSTPTQASVASSSSSTATAAPPTRIRRPSIRRTSTSGGLPLPMPTSASNRRSLVITPSASGDSVASSSSSSSSGGSAGGFQPKPLPHPHLNSTRAAPLPPKGPASQTKASSSSSASVQQASKTGTVSSKAGSSSSSSVKGSAMGSKGTMNSKSSVPLPPPPKYDLADEENLPSPFLKRIERSATMPVLGSREREREVNGVGMNGVGRETKERDGGGSMRLTATTKKRPSTGNLLRTMAAANNITRKAASSSASSSGSSASGSGADTANEGVVNGGATSASTVGTTPASSMNGGGPVLAEMVDAGSRASLLNARRAGEEARKGLVGR